MSGRPNPKQSTRASAKKEPKNPQTTVPSGSGSTSPSSHRQLKNQRHNARPSPLLSSHQTSASCDSHPPNSQFKDHTSMTSGSMDPPALPYKRPASSSGSSQHPSKKPRSEKNIAKVQTRLDELKLAISDTLKLAREQIEFFQGDEKHHILDVISNWEIAVAHQNAIRDEDLFQDLIKSRFAPQKSRPIFLVADKMFENFQAQQTIIKTAQGPSPSNFAKPSEWPEYQDISPILCLRPAAAMGLPIHTLYNGFRNFRLNISNPSFPITAVARVAAAELCFSMGNSFDDESARSNAFDSALLSVFPRWSSQYKVEPFVGHSFGLVDRAICIESDAFAIIFREDKLECGSTLSDGYLQVTRDYDLYVLSLKERNSSERVRAYINAGAPAFLLVVQGPLLHICGGFYDGKKVIVEPLTEPMVMLRDHTDEREEKLARGLTALKAGHDDIVTLITTFDQTLDQTLDTFTFPPSTPRLYRTCRLLNSELGSEGDLRFERPFQPHTLGFLKRTIFIGTLHYRSTPRSIKNVIVKIAPRYGQDVHCYLASKGLAPKLYAVSCQEGIPTAYVMEHLPPNWITLHDLQLRYQKATKTNFHAIDERLRHVLTLLKNEGFVHGDLRSNNIMIDIDTLLSNGEANIKILDFDWSGKADMTYYPGSRNPSVKWIGQPGGPIAQGDDNMLLHTWWGSQ